MTEETTTTVYSLSLSLYSVADVETDAEAMVFSEETTAVLASSGYS